MIIIYIHIYIYVFIYNSGQYIIHLSSKNDIDEENHNCSEVIHP